MSARITSHTASAGGGESGGSIIPLELRDTAPFADANTTAEDPELDRATLPAVLQGVPRASFVVELHVELDAMAVGPDQAGVLAAAVTRSLRAEGWNPSVVVCVPSPAVSYTG